MLSNCKDALDNSPIIAAIKDMAGLKKCLTCDSQVIFILFGDICNIADIVDKVKAAGKTAMVHIDLINVYHSVSTVGKHNITAFLNLCNYYTCI